MGTETVGIAILSALIYSVVFFAKHHFKPGKPESFKVYRNSEQRKGVEVELEGKNEKHSRK